MLFFSSGEVLYRTSNKRIVYLRPTDSSNDVPEILNSEIFFHISIKVTDPNLPYYFSYDDPLA